MPNGMEPRIAEIAEELTAWRRHMHAHPELAHKENDTAAFIARALKAMGLEPDRNVGGGVVAIVRGARPGPRIALRADMDALPIHEETNLPHASTRAGCMHACGHDGHSAMLLGAAKLLAEEPDFAGEVLLIFQPAEETGSGARRMVEEGLFQRWPCDSVWGLHNWPGAPLGRAMVHFGPALSAAETIEITVIGKGSHAALPHQGADPVMIGAQIVTALQSVVARSVDPSDQAVVSVTGFHAGDAINVIPDEARLQIDVRYVRPATGSMMCSVIERIARGVAAGLGAEARVKATQRFPATVNDLAAAAQAHETVAELLGEEAVVTNAPAVPGSEDFAWFLGAPGAPERPGAYIFLGGGDPEHKAALHNAGYDFNDRLAPIGVAYWLRLVNKLLGEGGRAAA